MIPTALLGMAGASGPAAAFNQLNAALGEVTNTIKKFTDAINPALGQMLTQTFNDLNATIGVALQPAMKAIVPVVRQLANTLFPLMEKLSSIIAVISGSVGEAFRKIIDALGVAMMRLMPLFEHLGKMAAMLADIIGSNLSIVINVLAGIIGALVRLLSPSLELFRKLNRIMMDVIRGFEVVAMGVISALEAMADSVSALFGGGAFGKWINNAMEMFQQAVRKAVQALILMTAMVMKFFGMKSGIQGMIDSIKGKNRAEQKDTVGLHVLNSPAYKAIEALGKDVALASFAGSMAGGEDPKKPEDFLKDILKELEGIRDTNWIEQLRKILQQEAKDFVTDFAQTMYKMLQDAKPGLEKNVFGPIDRALQSAGVTSNAQQNILDAMFPGNMLARRMGK